MWSTLFNNHKPLLYFTKILWPVNLYLFIIIIILWKNQLSNNKKSYFNLPKVPLEMNYECKITEDKRYSMSHKIRIFNSSERFNVQIMIDRIPFWKQYQNWILRSLHLLPTENFCGTLLLVQHNMHWISMACNSGSIRRK